MPPVPWYFEYFQAADRANCAPWELIDDWTPREFWKEAALVVAGAEADHAEFLQQRAEAERERQNAGTTAGIGRKLMRKLRR